MGLTGGRLDPVELAARLVRLPGLSGGENLVAEEVEEAMRSLGYREVSRDRLGSVIGVIGPEGSRPCLLLDGHMDVVPATGDWTVEPFGAEIINGRLYGRGTTDMKGGLAAAICGAALAERTGGLRAPVAVSATVLEETVEGIALAEVLDRVDPEAVVICEPSGLRLHLGQRGRMEIVLSVRGVPAHAAHPSRGVNPIDLAARALSALAALEPPWDPQLGRGILAATDIVSDPYPSISLIPSAVRIRFDRRTLVGEKPAEVLSGISSCLSEAVPTHAFDLAINSGEVKSYTGATDAPRRVLRAWRLEPEDRLAQAAMRAMGRAGHEVELGAYGFCTNGSESAGIRSIATIGLGPGSEEDAHVVDESVSVEEVRTATNIYKHLSLELAEGGAK